MELNLGYQGENNAYRVPIDVRSELAKWPGATVELMVIRPGEDEANPVVTELDGGTLYWIVKAYDVEKPGRGIAQAYFADAAGAILGKSGKMMTNVRRNLTGQPESGEVEVLPWMIGVMDAANAIRTGAAEATAAADRAEAAQAGAEAAQNGAEAAQNGAEAAQTAAETAKAGAEAAQAEAERFAGLAEQSANKAGWIYADIDENGHLIVTRTADTAIDLELKDGRMNVVYG